MLRKGFWLFILLSALGLLLVAGPATASPAAPRPSLTTPKAVQLSAYTLSYGRQALAHHGIRTDNALPSSIPQIDPLLLKLAREGHAQNISVQSDGTTRLLIDKQAAAMLRADGVTLTPLAAEPAQSSQPTSSVLGGTVTAGGSGLAGATVSAMLGSSVLTTTTSASGAYSLTVSGTGNYQMGVYASGYEWQPSVTVAAPPGAAAVNFALIPQNQTITGKVSGQNGGIAGAQVSANDPATDNFTAGDSTTTDASGFYTLTVSANTYEVRVLAAPLGVQSKTVRVPPSAANVNFQFATQTLYTVNGTVRTAAGQPLPAGELTISTNVVSINSCDAPYTQAAIAGADGTYSILLPAGAYSVYANWPSEWSDHWVIGASAQLNVSGNMTGFDVSLPAVATIRGTVTQPNGQPLANAKVFSWRADPNASPWFDGFFPTDASGNYIVTATLGVHNLVAFSDTYINSTTQNVNLTGNRTGVNMRVTDGIQAGGQLTGSDGQPLRWATLGYQAGVAGAMFNRNAIVYYDGSWKGTFASGTYTFNATQPMYVDQSRSVNIHNNPPTTNFTLVRKTQRLVGKANIVTGSGLCDTFMTATNVSTGSSTSGSSTGDGDFALMVPAGTYNVFPYKYNSNSSSFNSRVTVPPVPTSLNFTVTEQIFHDVMTDTYYYEPVAYLIYRNIASGYPDGTYRPANNTTRGQLSKLIVNAESWTIDTSGGPHFSDVPTSNPFYAYIETAYHHGVISGYADGTFQWGNNVTRAQLSKIIVASEGWAINTSGGPHFNDVPTTNPFYGFIETAVNKGILSGYADGTFRPGNNATRGQIAKIIYNALTQTHP